MSDQVTDVRGDREERGEHRIGAGQEETDDDQHGEGQQDAPNGGHHSFASRRSTGDEEPWGEQSVDAGVHAAGHEVGHGEVPRVTVAGE